MKDEAEMSAPMLGSVAWCFAAVLSIVLSLTACIGCDSPDTRQADGVDLKYRVVTVEGRKWIAYKNAHGHTHLAGPIDDK